MSDEEKKYVVFIEENIKEGETYIFYLQYTGNEYSLRTLSVYMANANYPAFNFSCRFYIDVKNTISERSVDEHIKINLLPMFEKVDGTFEFSLEDFVGLNPLEISCKLDDLYYGKKITKYFI